MSEARTDTGGMIVHGGFDWAGLMRRAFLELRLLPADFWALTPAEFLMLLGVGAGDGPMGRAQLSALSAAYPDQKGDGDG